MRPFTLFLPLLALALVATGAQAATFVVANTGDTGPGSL